MILLEIDTQSISGIDHCLLGSFSPLTLAETDPRAAAVLVEEFDAGGL
jgi:hypothetical protein